MDTILLGLISFGIGIISFGIGVVLTLVHLLYRNNRVYDLCFRLLHEDMTLYDKLPSYNTMLFHFWIPLSQFEKQARAQIR